MKDCEGHFSIARDRIVGAKNIAVELGLTEREARYKLARGLIPHAREGALHVASRRALLEWWMKGTGNGPTDPGGHNLAS